MNVLMSSPDANDAAWSAQYATLVSFFAEHGHSCVPSLHPKLGIWVAKQYVNEFDSHGSSMFLHDLVGKLLRGQLHFTVAMRLTLTSPPNLCFVFLYRRRGRYRAGKLRNDRIAKLNTLNFVWSPAEAEWMEKWKQLRDYEKEHGHCSIPIRSGELVHLGWWVNTQVCTHSAIYTVWESIGAWPALSTANKTKSLSCFFLPGSKLVPPTVA